MSFQMSKWGVVGTCSLSIVQRDAQEEFACCTPKDLVRSQENGQHLLITANGQGWKLLADSVMDLSLGGGQQFRLIASLLLAHGY